MLIYLYGTDDYRIRQRANQYIDEYQKKFGADLEWRKFDLTEKEATEKFLNFINTSSMFGGHKLAVLEKKNIVKEKVADNPLNDLGAVNSVDTIIVFLDIFPVSFDKKKTALKPSLKKSVLEKAAKSEELNSFADLASAKKWMEAELAKKSSGKLDSKAAKLLYENFGADTWTLANELEKLSLYRLNEAIREEDVVAACFLSDDIYVFSIFDAFFNRDKKKALFTYSQAIKSGIEGQAIFNLFVDQIRTAAYLVSGKQELLADVNPYKIKMIRDKLKNFSKEKILSIFQMLADIDDAIKNGRTDFESAMEYILFSF